ncbi:MAG: hypothetical protein CME26_04265 [Gemmatimonadetes bacterium]|nr:hypothetical protein [Gemmatimonadota bacterium]
MLVSLTPDRAEPVLGGKNLGDVGPYEQLYGSARFEIDPTHPLNEPIVDIRLAPVNERGRVECRADFWILKPLDASRGNGNLFYHVANRGRNGILSTFNLGDGSNTPSDGSHFGDGFLLEQGYTMATVGWQADVPKNGGDQVNLLTLDVPVIEDVTGPVACEIITDEPTDLHSLGSRYHHPYEPSEPHTEEATLKVRIRPYDTPEPIARDGWSFDRLPDGRAAVRYPEGFEPGLIYNLVYTARDPRVMGLGFATTRDFVSFLKHEASTRSGDPNPATVERAYTFGSSQSGRFLRHLLYLGFNEDETHRQVFDGVFANVAGGAQGSFNHRFAQPSRHASAHFDVYYPTEQFPFNDLPQTDSVTGLTAGLLDRCDRSNTTPRIFYTNTSTEYWNRSASLNHTDITGSRDVDVHDHVRIYHFSSTKHGPGDLPSGDVRMPANPVNFRFAFRALLVALDEWVREDRPPPPSEYATIESGTLVPIDPSAVGWPDPPGLPFPQHPRRPHRLDWGPRWAEEGIIDRDPPHRREPYPTRVSRVDEDGNEVAGIKMPEVEVPLGTFTGWEYRSEAMGATWALVGLAGIFLPFAPDAASADPNDPRRPVSARYTDRRDYVDRSVEAGRALIERRLMLDRDLDRVAERATAIYDWVVDH